MTNTLENMTLEQRIRLYAYGDEELPPHAFDFSKKDIELILSAITLVRMMAKRGYPHNFQRERSDIVEYCHAMTAMQGMAKTMIPQMRSEG